MFSDSVLSVEKTSVVEIRQYVQTSSGAYILSTECPCIVLDKIIIVFVADFFET